MIVYRTPRERKNFLARLRYRMKGEYRYRLSSGNKLQWWGWRVDARRTLWYNRKTGVTFVQTIPDFPNPKLETYEGYLWD
jgi:hypothetical protein